MKLKCLTCATNKNCAIRTAWRTKTARWGIAAPIIKCNAFNALHQCDNCQSGSETCDGSGDCQTKELTDATKTN